MTCVSNCINSKNREGDIKNHNAPIKKSLRSYNLFQWGNLVDHVVKILKHYADDLILVDYTFIVHVVNLL